MYDECMMHDVWIESAIGGSHLWQRQFAESQWRPGAHSSGEERHLQEQLEESHSLKPSTIRVPFPESAAVWWSLVNDPVWRIGIYGGSLRSHIPLDHKLFADLDYDSDDQDDHDGVIQSSWTTCETATFHSLRLNFNTEWSVKQNLLSFLYFLSLSPFPTTPITSPNSEIHLFYSQLKEA